MPVMRSVYYVPGNNEKFIAKSMTMPIDILTFDIEDAVPPKEKSRARELVRETLKKAADLGHNVYVRVNNMRTEWVMDDIEAIVHEGLHGICLPKTAGPDDVKRFEAKIEELEKKRGLKAGSISTQYLCETAIGIINAYAIATTSKRVNALIFGAVDYTLDMRVPLTLQGEDMLYARTHVAVAARAAGLKAIDYPFKFFRDAEAFEINTKAGRQLGYEGRMLIHPSQVEPAHKIFTPAPDEVEKAKRIVKAFEEEGIAKGLAAITVDNEMVDTPVYENCRVVLNTWEEIDAFDKKRKKA